MNGDDWGELPAPPPPLVKNYNRLSRPQKNFLMEISIIRTKACFVGEHHSTIVALIKRGLLYWQRDFLGKKSVKLTLAGEQRAERLKQKEGFPHGN